MRFSSRAATTWFLAGLFGVVAGMGEGLHLIPGCGHAVELPHGYLFVGLAKPKSTARPDDPSPAVGRPQGGSPSCYDEGDCPICRLSGQGKVIAAGVSFPLVLPIADHLPAIALQASPARAPQPFDARAPPIA